MFHKIDAALLARQFIRAARPSAKVATACVARFAAAPTLVPVQPARSAEPLRCFWNVTDHAAEYGGAAIFGSAIFEWPHLFWEAPHHAVWKDPAGQLIDITPPAAPREQPYCAQPSENPVIIDQRQPRCHSPQKLSR